MTDERSEVPINNRMSRSERFRNYLIGIGAMTGLILGLMAQLKGEPVAEKTWETLRGQVNKQSESINELHTQIEVIKAIQEAQSSLILRRDLEDLQKKYDDLVEDKEGSAAELSSCRQGSVRVSDGSCRAAPTAVTEKMKRDEKQAASTRKELHEERRKRLESELEKKELVRKFYDRPAQKQLQALPESLDEASE